FLANLFAIFALAALLTVVVNAASFVLFPIAVVGLQGSFSKLFRFAFGHALSVSLSSAFCFLAIFALSGSLLACLPYRIVRKVSVYVRFAVAFCLLALLATSFTVSSILSGGSKLLFQRLGGMPPAWFLGLTETLWGNGNDIFFASLTRRAAFSLGLALLISVISYAVSFRRAFVRIPEFADVGPLPRGRRFPLPAMLLNATVLAAVNLPTSYPS